MTDQPGEALMTVTFGAAAIAGALRMPSTAAAASAAAAAPSRGLAFATLGTWLLDAVSGGYMLRTWIVRGGLRRQRASDGLAPRVVFGHFGLASTGLLLWAGYLASRWIVLAWLAVGLLTLVIGLGVSTVTVWTPFPAHRPDAAGEAGAGEGPGGHGGGPFGGPAEDALTGALTDEVLKRALTDEVLLRQLVEDVVIQARAGPRQAPKRHRAHLANLIPAGHGVAAMATILLAALTAAGAS
jgi:hypothetical protein